MGPEFEFEDETGGSLSITATIDGIEFTVWDAVKAARVQLTFLQAQELINALEQMIPF
jgi:hypothetical protein